jgi:hypothetical protein
MDMVWQQTDRIDGEWETSLNIKPSTTEQVSRIITGEHRLAAVSNDREEIRAPGNPRSTIIRHGLDYI